MTRLGVALGLAVAVWLASSLGLALLLETQDCAVGWLPGWVPDWAAFCARDPGVIAARAVQVADWHRALPLMLAAATFALTAWPWHRR